MFSNVEEKLCDWFDLEAPGFYGFYRVRSFRDICLGKMGTPIGQGAQWEKYLTRITFDTNVDTFLEQNSVYTILCLAKNSAADFFLMNNNNMMLSKYFYTGMMLSKYFCNVMMLLKNFCHAMMLLEVLMVQKPQYPFSVVQFALSQTFNIGIKATTCFHVIGSRIYLVKCL